MAFATMQNRRRTSKLISVRSRYRVLSTVFNEDIKMLMLPRSRDPLRPAIKTNISLVATDPARLPVGPYTGTQACCCPAVRRSHRDRRAIFG